MVRENSFSDSDGRSLTPDLSEEEDQDFIGPSSPTADNSNFQGQMDLNQIFPTPRVQPTTSGAVMSESGTAAAGTGLPPSASPSVIFKDPVSKPAETTRSASTPAAPGRSEAAERFRASVRKVIHMNRGSSALSMRNGVGAEPGIDPRRASAFMNYGHIRQKCTIELVDYSSLRVSFGKFENRGFEEFMMDSKASHREPWVKVRWINIGGVSWDVISALAIKYDIHPLALEDILHRRGNQARSKADYYLQHLFVRILRHTLGSDDEDGKSRATVAPGITRLPRSSSPDPMGDGDEYDSENGDWGEEKTVSSGSGSSRKPVGSMRKAQAYANGDIEQGRKEALRGTKSPRPRSYPKVHRKRYAETMTIEQLKRGERVIVDTIPFFIFLFRDGTVISINQTPDIDFTGPIIARLRQRDTGLRATADPSLLVQSLLDLIVDQALEVVDEYQQKILKLEHEVLIKPKMKTVRQLHIISGDLTLHKRTLDPIKTLVYGLRRYDVDRCAALMNSSGANGAAKVEGFMTHKSKIYLADVHDHIDYIINSIDMFSSISENLINFTFNMASYEMNEVMRRLTMATIIFLPLTLLTGYFGMNFEHMWSITNSDVFFWEIAIPMMLVVIPIFTWPDIERMIHFFKKRWAARKVKKAIKHSAKKTQ